MRQKCVLLCGLLTSSLFITLFQVPHAAFAEVSVRKPYAITMSGDRILSIGVNTQVILQVVLNNSENIDQPYLAIIEVRNSDDITVYLQFQKCWLAPTSENEVGVSWSPEQEGEYSIRTFVISSLDNPEVLSPVASNSIDVGEVTQLDTSVIDDDTIVTPPPDPENSEISELKQYALELINNDREEHNLPPVKFSNNAAAQILAQDVFETKVISHWMSNGEKPYMTYTRYGGTGDVGQNVATSGYEESYHKCISFEYLCTRLDPFDEIKDHQYGMMYDDKECCDNGHRDNILDPYHTHVSIGIVYDDYFLAFVQNFENNYVKYDQLESDRAGYVTMEGTMEDAKPAYVAIFYDEYPTTLIYNRDRDSLSYGFGDLLAYVVEPLEAGYRYPPNSDYYIFEARRWLIQGNSFAIEFSLGQLMEKEERGIYTIYFVAEREGEEFPVTSYSVFKE